MTAAGATAFETSVLSGAAAGVAGGATERYLTTGFATGSVKESLKAAADPTAVATDLTLGAVAGGLTYGAARAGQAWGARSAATSTRPPTESPTQQPPGPPAPTNETPQASASYKVTTESGQPTISFGEGAPTLGYEPNANPSAPPALSPLDIRPGPGVKAVAGTPGGPLVTSGVDETAVEVFKLRTATGQPQLSHFRDIGGTPGTYFATHAEPKAFLLNPAAESVTVSKPPCVGCIEGFKFESLRLGRAIEIHAPTSAGPGTWTFQNGGVWVTPFTVSF